MPRGDPHPDPFGEHVRDGAAVSYQLLGARCHFRSSSARLLRLVHWAYADLPEHEFSAKPPQLNLRLVLNEGSDAHPSTPPQPTLLGGDGLLGAVAGSGSFVALSPEGGTALAAISATLLRHPYHARYELIEFAVFSLAARVQQLIALHAACVSLNDRGVVLMGASGAGKSTLSLHCLLQRQLDFVAEDAVFVSAQRMVATGIANFLHVCPETLQSVTKQQAQLFRRSPTIQRRSGVKKLEVDLRRGAHRLAVRPPHLAGVVFLSPRPGGRELLRPLAPHIVRKRLNAAQRYAAAQPGWDRFASHLEALGGYELRRGRHPQEGADRLTKFLADGR